MLYIIGLGLCDEKDLTLRGLEAVKKCERIYLENYTSKLQCNINKLEELYGKKIIPADRELVEKKAEQTILADAEKKETAFLVVGDATGATTHADLILRAREKNIPVAIINNASIINAVGNTGLELYKFGKTTSIVFPEKNFSPESCYDTIMQNQSINAHTLCLLDIKIEASERFMTINQAVRILFDIEKKRKQKIITEETEIVGCARIGCNDQLIKYGKAKDLVNFDFGKPLHCLIVPAELHFKEEEMLEEFKIK